MRKASRGRGAPVHAVETGPVAAIDGGVLFPALALISIGIVITYSATAPLALDHAVPPLFLRHLVHLALALACGAAAMLLPLRLWRLAALPLWLAALLLLAATAWLGVEVNGARRWLAVPGLPFAFQPVELVKLSTLAAVAALAAPRDGHRELSPRRAAAAVALTALPVALLLQQPDLGNAVLLGALVAMLLLAAGSPLRPLVPPSLLAAGGIALYVATHSYALRRVEAFLDPWKDARGAGFQLVQSFVAFAQGGLLGTGLGNGRQKLFYLPEAHTDFVLALIAEELGLVGVLLVLGAFAALWTAGTRIARGAQSRFALLLAFGMSALLALPALVNAAVVMGCLPTKGLTLPFLSYGGTSLVTSCTALGLLIGIARRQAPGAGAQPGAAPRRSR